MWEEKHKWGKPLYKHLRHRGRRYNKRNSSYKSRGIPGRVGIEQRPAVVDEKGRFGNLEIRKGLHTMTADNGTEFSRHQQIARALKIDIFFARPYHSWERGANENTNGLVRQYFLKGSDFTKITDKDINMVQDRINNRPRKRLNYKTPVEFIRQKYGENKTIIKLLRY